MKRHSVCIKLILSAFLLFATEPIFAAPGTSLQGTPSFYFDAEVGIEKPVSPGIIFSEIKLSPAGRFAFESRFFNVWGVFAGFDWDYLLQNSDSLEPWSVYGADIGTGIRFELLDRLGVRASALTGVYKAAHNTDTEGTVGFSGMTFGADCGLECRLTPSLSLIGQGVFLHRMHSETPLSTMRVSLGLSINVSEIVSPQDNFSVAAKEIKPVFPVLYSWYNDNAFATIELFNGEDTAITDVDVYFYSEKYMAQSKYCGRIDKIKRGTTATIDLTAFFNESVLQLVEKTDASCSVILEYKKLGEKRRTELSLAIPIYHRNAMNWEDDRRAASFVSPNDIEVQEFAKKIATIVRPNVDVNMNEAVQYSAAIFESLGLYGIKYVIDPASAYADNAGSFSIDFLQFPHQTLNYFGGDCDDLSILYCSLMEALGIETAFITVPGHIYTAILVGTKDNVAGLSSRTQQMVVEQDGKLWLPIEITMIGDGFNAAMKYGANEWNKAAQSNAAKLYPVHDSWKMYKSVAAPGAESGVFIPNSDKVMKAFMKEKNDL